jgi:hypothetical protein
MPTVNHSASIAVTLLGAITAFLFANRKLPSCIKRLAELFPGCSERTYQRLDAFIVIVVGCTVGCLFCTHTTYAACLMSGLTWATSIRMLLGSEDHGGRHPLKAAGPGFFR